jgi:hypothetical protein
MYDLLFIIIVYVLFRTLLDVLRSMCCMVRHDGEQEPCNMYEVNTEDWKASSCESQSQLQVGNMHATIDL